MQRRKQFCFWHGTSIRPGTALTTKSIHDEQFRATRSATAVRRITIAYVVTHPRLQRETFSIREMCFEFPNQAQQHMSFRAPVIRFISWRVLHHTHADVAKLLRPPQRLPAIAGMFSHWNLAPVRRGERQFGHFHMQSISAKCDPAKAHLTSKGSYRLDTAMQKR